MPDPQDPATFARSKLHREGDAALRDLYARLIRARAALEGEATDPAFDEDARWLRVAAAAPSCAMNFAREPREVPVGRRARSSLATHDAELRDGRVTLPPLAGALVR